MNETQISSHQGVAAFNEADKVLMIAGPGSGKTATLIERLFHLLDQGCESEFMMVITFTNAAANELEKRIYSDQRWSIGHADHTLGYVGTLHGFLMALLGKHHRLAGLPEKLSVIDDEQKVGLLEDIAKELGVKKYSAKKESLKLRRPPAGVTLTQEELVAREYYRRLQSSGLLDFDSILHFGLQLIQNLVTLGWEVWKWQALFVDEYQDSASEDSAIYGAMACRWKFVVGDPDQSIYKFRGGDVRNILALAESITEGRTVPGWALCTVEINYRCAVTICQAANRLIANNPHRLPKLTLAADYTDGRVDRIELNSAGSEMAFVAHAINQGLDSPCDIAVLARTNRIAEDFGKYLTGLGIGVRRKKAVVQPGDWRMAKLLLTVLMNPWNDFAAKQYIEARRGDKEAKNLHSEAVMKMQSLNDFALHFTGNENFNELMVKEGISMESRQRMADAVLQLIDTKPVYTLSDLLIFISLGEEHRQEEGEGVTVTTFHSAKGREWHTVYLVAAEQEIVPDGRKNVDIEEERRLFYVAITRAKRKLVITHCKTRPAPFGPMVLREATVSQFVKEALP